MKIVRGCASSTRNCGQEIGLRKCLSGLSISTSVLAAMAMASPVQAQEVIDGGTAVTVDGSGDGTNGTKPSPWSVADTLIVGKSSSGQLSIINGGSTSNYSGIIGELNGSTGAVTVNGIGSSWTNQGILLVGYQGVGSLAISAGGHVSNTTVGSIGRSSGSSGTVTIDGAGSNWINSGTLYIGEAGTGSLAISAGGHVSNTAGRIGRSSGSSGTVTIDGADSIWSNSGSLYIGDEGTGSLAISAGASVSSADFSSIGFLVGSSGTVTVDGAGSNWTMDGTLEVGFLGAGSLAITTGGKVSNRSVVIGQGAGSSGAVTVDGAGSSWANSGSTGVGLEGTGSLSISGGASVSTAGFANIGAQQRSSGTVTVDGLGSSWTIAANLAVGFGGTGSLDITNGGSVNNVLGVLGFNGFSSGTVTVDGVGSTWTSGDPLWLAVAGNGSLTVSNGGVVSAPELLVAMLENSIGMLTIGAAAGNAATSAGIIDSPTLTFGEGNGILAFNHTDADYDFSSSLGGVGSVEHYSGTTKFTADSSEFAGATNVHGGSLIVSGSLGGTTSINDGGLIGGTGSVGAVTVEDGGILSPGSSIGTLNLSGDLVFNAGSIFVVEANAFAQSDKVAVTGSATLNGGTVIVLAEDQTYSANTLYTILSSHGGVSGQFDNVSSNLAFLTPSLGYGALDVTLTLTRNDTAFPTVALNQNQASVAAAVAKLNSASPIFTSLLNQSIDGAQSAFAALSGQVYVNLSNSLLGDAEDLRLTLATSGEASEGISHFGSSFSYRQGSMASRASMPINRNAESGGIGSYVLGTSFANGTWKATIVSGRAAGGDQSLSTGESAAVTTRFIGGNVMGHLGEWSLVAGGGVAWHDLITDRSVRFGSFTDATSAQLNAVSRQGFTEVSYRATIPSVELTPYSGLYISQLSMGQAFERGNEAALEVDSTSRTLAAGAIGLRAAVALQLANGWHFKPAVDASIRHNFGDLSGVAEMRFSGSTADFAIASAPISRRTLAINGGIELSGNGLSIGAFIKKNSQAYVEDWNGNIALSARF